jgi:hypothetical protein
MQPPLTRADRQVLAALAKPEERRSEQRVQNVFTDDEPGTDAEGPG